MILRPREIRAALIWGGLLFPAPASSSRQTAPQTRFWNGTVPLGAAFGTASGSDLFR